MGPVGLNLFTLFKTFFPFNGNPKEIKNPGLKERKIWQWGLIRIGQKLWDNSEFPFGGEILLPGGEPGLLRNERSFGGSGFFQFKIYIFFIGIWTLFFGKNKLFPGVFKHGGKINFFQFPLGRKIGGEKF